jgi:hypothetical protein
VDSSSRARRALASLEFRRDSSAACRAAFSSAKARSAANQVAFSSDNTFLTVASSVVKATNLEHCKVRTKNHRLEAAKEEWVPTRSASISFKPSR